jgi:formylglycine-generating enzyme required for sulfatase activity
MVPVYDPGANETAKDARVCIDQFEFPDIPCAFPVVFPTPREAALLCAAVGKRICDAHEWEGACAGAVHTPEVEYAFGKERPYATWLHNEHREVRWAYGAHKNHALCATQAVKSPRCPGGGWTLCGTHTWPAGSFLACVSPFGVYDQHGNAAEHMNLPLSPAELASRGGTGATEMKGSWFIFEREEAHEDDCRWRAKDWHPSALMAEDGHRNYHLGFRCCKSVAPAASGR